MIQLFRDAGKASRGHGIWFMTIVVSWFVLLAAWEFTNNWWERTVQIYEDPQNVESSISDDGTTLQFQATSKKKANCRVIENSPVIFSVMIDHGMEEMEPRQYPAIRYDGKTVGGAPIVSAGQGFIVGPWMIKDDPKIIRKIRLASIRLKCRFDSGVMRTAIIGPMKIQ